jgi:hypothetical protein
MRSVVESSRNFDEEANERWLRNQPESYDTKNGFAFWLSAQFAGKQHFRSVRKTYNNYVSYKM